MTGNPPPDDRTTRLVDEEDAVGTSTGNSAEWPQIAGYGLIERLASGGMGEVFPADQTEPVERRVTLIH